MSFVSGVEYSQMKGDKIYQIDGPETYIDGPDGLDSKLYRFEFRRANEANSSNKCIYIANTLVAKIGISEFDLAVICWRAVYDLLNTDGRERTITTNSYQPLLCAGAEVDPQRLRRDIYDYCRKRWGLSMAPFCPIEFIASLRADVKAIADGIAFFIDCGLLTLPRDLKGGEFTNEFEKHLGVDIGLSVQRIDDTENILNKLGGNAPRSVAESPTQSELEEASKEYDAFICHASEDKGEIVEPLAKDLRESGFNIWYDDFCLLVGDDWVQKIEQGMKNSRYGIVVLSPVVPYKHWAQKELHALQALRKRILPVWHKVDSKTVGNNWPFLASIQAVKSSQGLKIIMEQLAKRLSLRDSRAS